MYIFLPVNAVTNKPLLAQVLFATLQIEGSTLREYRIGVQQRHQRGKSSLVFTSFVGAYVMHVREGRMCPNVWIPSFSPVFTSLERTSVSRLWHLDDGTLIKRILNTHYCKPTCISFRNVETDIFHRTVGWTISKLAASPTGWSHRSTH